MQPYVTPNSPKGGSKSEFVVWNIFRYISVIAEANDFKIGMHLGFAKIYHQIPLEEKAGVDLG